MELQTTGPMTGSRRRRFALAALIGLAVLAGAGALLVRARLDPGAPVAGVTEVAIHDNAFAPTAIEVPVGTTVTWHWDGREQHNVVGDGFQAPTQANGAFAHTFGEPGTYPYRCALHYFMRGEVVVTD